MSKLGLNRVIEEGIPTQSKGNTLDGIWTNLKVTKCTLTDFIPEIIDHSLCQITILLDKDISRTIPQKVQEYYTSLDIRR
jgi:hypothetical protein